MSTTQEVQAWTYTNGYPDTFKKSTTTVSRHNTEGGSSTTSPHLLLRVQACALNPVDVQMMNLPKWNSDRGEKGTVCDFSGTVVSSADDKARLKPGDEVFGITLTPMKPGGGSLAEMTQMELGASALAVRKPAAWSHEQAAAVSLVWLTAKTSVEAVASWVEASAAKRVAVLGGSSATGIYSVILAKRKGWKVLATSSGRNKDFVMSTLGADEHVDYTSQDVRSGVESFRPDAVIDCVGGTECIGLPSSKRYITIVGDKTGRSTMGGPYTYYDYQAPLRAAAQWLRWAKGRLGLGESYDIVILSMRKEWLEEAKETLSPDDIYVDSVWDFDDANKAFERLNTGRAKGKVVVRIGDGSGRPRL